MPRRQWEGALEEPAAPAVVTPARGAGAAVSAAARGAAAVTQVRGRAGAAAAAGGGRARGKAGGCGLTRGCPWRCSIPGRAVPLVVVAAAAAVVVVPARGRRVAGSVRFLAGSSDGPDEPDRGAAWPLVPRLAGCFFGRVSGLACPSVQELGL